MCKFLQERRRKQNPKPVSKILKVDFVESEVYAFPALNIDRSLEWTPADGGFENQQMVFTRKWHQKIMSKNWLSSYVGGPPHCTRRLFQSKVEVQLQSKVDYFYHSNRDPISQIMHNVVPPQVQVDVKTPLYNWLYHESNSC